MPASRNARAINLGAAVVAVQARLGDQYAIFFSGIL
jgi:hypothetical protein